LYGPGTAATIVTVHDEESWTKVVTGRRVLITGGGTFLGNTIASALLAEGASVTLLVQTGCEENLGLLANHVQWHSADFWDTASLRGRARDHAIVIHTVGSMRADPAQGLSFQRLNFTTARNVAAMCISDGVPEMILLSTVRAPWVASRYVHAKREAETYLARVGVEETIIRAPIAYVPGARRPMLFALLSILGQFPPFSWTRLGRIAPIRVDLLARGVARIALEPQRSKRIYYARDLRKRNQQSERRVNPSFVYVPTELFSDDTLPHGLPVQKRDKTESVIDETTE
jgi:uncharacterized protein YbjT (DUF2867 family)